MEDSNRGEAKGSNGAGPLPPGQMQTNGAGTPDEIDSDLDTLG